MEQTLVEGLKFCVMTSAAIEVFPWGAERELPAAPLLLRQGGTGRDLE